MKWIIFLLILFLPINAMATTYHVATDGSGDFTTIAQVNAATFQPGDSVLFRKGDIFRNILNPDSGAVGNPITYGSYGIGDLPKLMKSKQETSPSDWTNLGGNIWSNNDSSFVVDVGNIVFNSNSVGVKCVNESDLTEQGEFWYDSTNDLVKLYSIENPASFYTNIEVCLNYIIIYQASPSNVIIENLHILNTGGHGINFSNASNITIRNCQFDYIGGSYLTGTTRYGNGIEFLHNASNVLVEKCIFNECYDESITSQGTMGTVVDGVTFKNNICIKDYYGMTITHDTPVSGTVSNVSFYNNTFISTGQGWSKNQRTVSDKAHCIAVYDHGGEMVFTNINIKNNIFYNCIDIVPLDTSLTTNGLSGTTFDYNSYNVLSGAYGKLFFIEYTTLSAWQLATNQDLHSISADPLLNADYTLQAGSPCINAGVKNLGVDTDYNGVKRRGTPDIGAYEYVHVQPRNCLLRNCHLG